MASTSHRNCQYRGDGCTGKAHAGHDQCAWCYFQYVKPALQAERAEMKRRRAIKRHQLSQANRSLISEVDLKEPQMREVPEEAPLPFSGPAAFTVRDAVLDTVILQEIDRGIAAGKDPYEAGGDLLLKTELRHIPANIYPVPRAPEKETTQTDMLTTTTTVPEAQHGRHRAAGKPPLTDATRQEIADAFAAGMATGEICSTYEIGAATLYAIVRKAGLPLRGRNGRSPQETQMPTNTPPASTTDVAVSPPNGVVSGLTEWTVTYAVRRTETRVVAAKTFNDAAAAVEAEGVEVVSVSRGAWTP